MLDDVILQFCVQLSYYFGVTNDDRCTKCDLFKSINRKFGKINKDGDNFRIRTIHFENLVNQFASYDELTVEDLNKYLFNDNNKDHDKLNIGN